jgi:glyoxylase-like metal-dependent hydrolase (beta-lactamase superfamily II)
MFRIEMLPAARGDCLWIEYGDPAFPCRVIVDGGVSSTAQTLRARIEALPAAARCFELLVVTHLDLDHIAGIISLLENPPEGLFFSDVWFNGWRHLPPDIAEEPEVLSVRQAEALTELLTNQEHPWNRAFGGEAVRVEDKGPLPRWTLPGGMRLTLLSPSVQRLRRLRRRWEKEVEAEKTRDQPGHPDERTDRLEVLGGPAPDLDRLARSLFKPDDSVPNGSSIAFVAEFGGKRCLLAGDAFAPDVQVAVERLAAEEGETQLELDALKLAHHGGQKNTSADLLTALVCTRYLFSSDGSIYDHPHHEAVARVVVHGRRRGPPRLFFNYRSEQNRLWDNRSLFRGRYEPFFPGEEQAGMVVDL